MRDERSRAVSTVLGYTLALAITSLAISGLVLASAGHVTESRSSTIRSQLQVVGQELATDLVAADRLVRSGTTTSLTLTTSLPDRVTGDEYLLTTTGDQPTTITLRAPGAGIEVSVALWIETSVAPARLNGGPVVISYTGGALEVRND